jgi:hypothetical protein
MQVECEREQDVLDAIAAARWPGRCDQELRAHVDGCPICQDAALVFAAVAELHDETCADAAAVPPASIVWWRAQMRAREEAARTAARPIAVAQGVGLAAAGAGAVALIPIALPWVKEGAQALADVVAWLGPRAEAVSSAFALVTGTGIPILPFAIASILLAPVLLYYAFTEE